MPRAANDATVLSYRDTNLRPSDIATVNDKNWINDQVISFYFEYLYERKFDCAPKLCLIGPDIAQFVKMTTEDQLHGLLAPMKVAERDVVVVPVNNNDNAAAAGGTHWSLLIYSREAGEFYHFDSARDMNEAAGYTMASQLHKYLTRAYPNTFQLKFIKVRAPEQGNSYQCGIHLLCHAEHATRHIMVYGNDRGLEMLDMEVVKGMRKRLLDLIKELQIEERERKQKEASAPQTQEGASAGVSVAASVPGAVPEEGASAADTGDANRTADEKRTD